MNRKVSKSIIGVFAGAVMLTTAAPAGAASVRGGEVKRLTSLYAGAASGSPAQFRIHEELDRLAAEDAAPPSAAAFRLAEMQSR